MYAQMALDRNSTDTPISNTRTEDLSKTRVIFFAGDAIPPHEKYEMPEVKGFGGIYMPEIRTLPKGANNASKGMVYRCTFTPLRTTMKHEAKNMLSPDARQHWESSFNQAAVEDGKAVQRNVLGFTESVLSAAKEGRFETVSSPHVVYKFRYPGEDIAKATTRLMPNGVGGVVEAVALAGATDDEIREAQLFFFPNWDEIVSGLDMLPETTKELEAHIRARLATTTNAKYLSLGKDILRSCSEFRRTGAQIVTRDESALKAASKDDTQAHSAISEHLLPQLEIARKGDILAGDHQAMNRVANAMEKNIAASPSGISEADRALKERELFIEEVRLGIRNPDGTLKGVTATVSAVAGATVPDVPMGNGLLQTDMVLDSVRYCNHPKNNGEPCERTLKDGEAACFQHVDKSE